VYLLFKPWRWKWWLLLIRSVDGGDKIKTAGGAGPVGGVGRRRPGRRGGLGRSVESLTDGPASINSRAHIHRRTKGIRRRRLEGLLGVARRQEKTNYKKKYIYIFMYNIVYTFATAKAGEPNASREYRKIARRGKLMAFVVKNNIILFDNRFIILFRYYILYILYKFCNTSSYLKLGGIT
jgi:hypothetical protein